MTRVLQILMLIVCRLPWPDIIDIAVAIGCLYGIWHGLSQVHRPAAEVAVSALVLAGVVVARTRKAGP